MEDIPLGFFTLPSLEYLVHEPNTPYSYPTSGLLHSSKYSRILSTLFEGNDPDLVEIFEGHALQREINRFTRNELADFCRHILIINRDKIGWQVVDKYLDLLTKHTGLPKWEKVDILFIGEVKILFSSLVHWEISEFHLDLIKQFIEQSPVMTLNRDRILDNISTDYRYWKLRDLWIFFENLILLRISDYSQYQKYDAILGVIINLFEEEMRKLQDEPSKRVILMTLLARGFVKLGYDKIGELFDRTSRIWIDLEHDLTELELKSYRYLLAIIFSYIGLEYYKFNISFVHNRQLILRILASYFEFEEITMEEWFDSIKDSDADFLLKEYLWNGFSAVEQLLREYSLELVSSPEKKEITELQQELSKILYHGSIEILKQVDSNARTDEDLIISIDMRARTDLEFRKVLDGLSRILSHSYRNLSCLDIEWNSYERFLLIESILNLTFQEIEVRLFVKHLELLNTWFSTDELVQRIELESQETGSIINSSTFENEFISLASQVMDLVKQRYNKTGALPLSLLEQLFFFLVEWLEIFRSHGGVYQDFLLIISPIISIIQVHIIQAYYERNQHALALVEYINFQYMASVFRSQMDLIGVSDVDITTEYLASEYQSMVKNWHIASTITIEALSKSIKSIELKFINQKQEMTGMIQDEILMGYLELAQNMEAIIESGIDGIKFYTLAEQYYQPPSPEAHLYTHVGNNTSNSLKIPLFPNPRQYNAAISVIPFTVDLSGQMVGLDLNSLLQYFQIKGENSENNN